MEATDILHTCLQNIAQRQTNTHINRKKKLKLVHKHRSGDANKERKKIHPLQNTVGLRTWTFTSLQGSVTSTLQYIHCKHSKSYTSDSTPRVNSMCSEEAGSTFLMCRTTAKYRSQDHLVQDILMCEIVLCLKCKALIDGLSIVQ